MGKVNLLACLDKRDLLNQSAISVDKLLEWGSRYEEEGLISDAVEFYERANGTESLERLLGLVREEGDAFLFGRILRALGREGSPEEWIAVGEKASELGKTGFARLAFQRGGRDSADEAEAGESSEE